MMGCGSKATRGDLAPQFPRSPWTPGPLAPDGLGRVVQGIVTALLRDGYPDLRSVAKSIGLSARTLQRRLSEEGVTYARVVAQARLEIAQRMLDDPARRVIEVALDLGYSDQAHFGRAFARWTGLAPRQFRRLRKAGFGLDANGIDIESRQHPAGRGPA